MPNYSWEFQENAIIIDTLQHACFKRIYHTIQSYVEGTSDIASTANMPKFNIPEYIHIVSERILRTMCENTKFYVDTPYYSSNYLKIKALADYLDIASGWDTNVELDIDDFIDNGEHDVDWNSEDEVTSACRS